jgi:proline racemase
MPEKRLGSAVLQYTHDSSCFAHPEIEGDVHAKQQLFWNTKQLGWDRSPCGTGTSGRLAQLYARGLIKMNQELINESMIGTFFRGRIVAKAKVGTFDAIIPEITGNVWITAISTIVFDPTDPFKYGFQQNMHPYYLHPF